MIIIIIIIFQACGQVIIIIIIIIFQAGGQVMHGERYEKQRSGGTRLLHVQVAPSRTHVWFC